MHRTCSTPLPTASNTYARCLKYPKRLLLFSFKCSTEASLTKCNPSRATLLPPSFRFPHETSNTGIHAGHSSQVIHAWSDHKPKGTHVPLQPRRAARLAKSKQLSSLVTKHQAREATAKTMQATNMFKFGSGEMSQRLFVVGCSKQLNRRGATSLVP